jgi:outer membrane immunogenic protein
VDAVAGGGTFTTGPLHHSDGIFGGTLGYNWQNGPWVGGVEGDFSWTDLAIHDQRQVAPNCTPGSCISKLDELGTARLRGGYLISNSTLIYVTGGAAFGHLGTGLTFAGAPPVQAFQWETGWTVGGGIEAMLSAHWTVKAEYLYVDLGNGPTIFNGGATFDHTANARVNIVRAGLNYKF